jgi:hypothetical protein
VVSFFNMAMAVLINANPPDGFPANPGINLNNLQIYFIHHGLPTLFVAALDICLLITTTILYARTLPWPTLPSLKSWLSGRVSPLFSRQASSPIK